MEGIGGQAHTRILTGVHPHKNEKGKGGKLKSLPS
jgi:hypothetical protein